MTLYSGIFHVLAVVILASTLLAIIQRQVIHAVVYLIVSFFATGLLFYLLGAPFLAALEVIVYAGAIMVLFLFIVMTVKVESGEDGKGDPPMAAGYSFGSHLLLRRRNPDIRDAGQQDEPNHRYGDSLSFWPVPLQNVLVPGRNCFFPAPDRPRGCSLPGSPGVEERVGG